MNNYILIKTITSKTLKIALKSIITLIFILSLIQSVNTVKTNAETLKNDNRIDKIMLCTESIYNDSTNLYTSTMRDEDGNLYNVYTYDNIKYKWFYSTVDTKGTESVLDDEIIGLEEMEE